MEKNGNKITQIKWPKYQNPKDETMGWKNKRELKLGPFEFLEAWKANLRMFLNPFSCS